MRWFSSLQFKILAGILPVLGLLLGVIAYLQFSIDQTQHAQQGLRNVAQLELAVDALKRRAGTYKTNAPRDFESYERDLAVFHKDFTRDMQTLDQVTDELSLLYQQDMKSGIFRSLLGLQEQDQALAEIIETLSLRQKQFQAGFSERIGDNEQEPRLEWGAEYIQVDPAGLYPAVRHAAGEYRKHVVMQDQVRGEIANIGIWAAGLSAVLLVIWFQLGLVRRIHIVAKGCQQVSEGAFGYQIPENGNDELTDLVRAFNNLTARTQLVLSTLSDVQEQPNLEATLNLIRKDWGGYLDLQWVGLLEVNGQGDIRLKGQSPEVSDPRLLQASEPLEGSMIESLIKKGEPVRIGDVAGEAMNNGRRGLISRLFSVAGLHSLMAIRLPGENGQETILVFGHRNKDAFSREQSSLIQRLGGLVAGGMTRHLAMQS